MTIIRTSRKNPLKGIANGRPVAFCAGEWSWYYTDCQGHEVPETIRGQVVTVRK